MSIVGPWSDPAHVNTDLGSVGIVGPWSDPAHEADSPLSASVTGPWSDPAWVDTLDAGQFPWSIATPTGFVGADIYSATP